MTSYLFNGIRAYVWYVSQTNRGLYIYTVEDYDYSVRPVVSLKPDVAVTGNGLVDDPYVVE